MAREIIVQIIRELGENESQVYNLGMSSVESIKDTTQKSKDGHIYREYEIHYENGKVVELLGGVFTVVRQSKLDNGIN